MDNDEEAAKMRQCFALADRVVQAARTLERPKAGGRLTIVGSDFYGSSWAPPGETRQEGFPDSKRPQIVLSQALCWLTGSVLPDVLEKDLRVVFCGNAAGTKSAQEGCYYAGPGNKFWEIVCQTSLTKRELRPFQFVALLEDGIGLTDLAKHRSGSDKDIPESALDVPGFYSKMKQYRPKVVALNGKAAAKAFFGHPVDYGGPQFDERVGGVPLFVLPSTSGAARQFWDESHWKHLAEFVGQH